MKVLLVDDAKIMRIILKDALVRHLGILPENVHEAENGHDAVRMYAQVLPDVVFLDIHMPGIKGDGVVREIITSHPGAYFIVCTSSYGKTGLLECLRAGACDYIRKPLTTEKITRVMSNRNSTPAAAEERLQRETDTQQIKEIVSVFDKILHTTQESLRD